MAELELKAQIEEAEKAIKEAKAQIEKLEAAGIDATDLKEELKEEEEKLAKLKKAYAE